MPQHTEFRSVSNIGQKTLSEIVSDNLIAWLDWSFLCIGAFQNVALSGVGIYGVNKSKFRLVDDKRYSLGQCWESYRGHFVWESGIPVAVQPTRPSGVYVGSVFYPSNTSGAYAHIIDYPKGRVVFNTAIASGSTVETEYSYRNINVMDANLSPYFQRIQLDSERVDDPQFLSTYSGTYYNTADTRVQLPQVAIDVTSFDNSRPAEIGSGGRWKQNKIGFYVFAENDRMCDRIGDILQDQEFRTLYLYDSNLVASGNYYPLTSSGTIASGAKTYQQMVDFPQNGGYFLTKIYIDDARTSHSQALGRDLHLKVVTFSTEVLKY